MVKVRRGFTLIELLVVTSVIGVLAYITTVAYPSLQSNVRDSERSSRVSIISEGLEKYYEKNGEYPNCGAVSAQPASSVTTSTLKDLDPNILTAPSATSGTNSIVCADDNSKSDVYIYNVESDLSQFSLSYRKEGTTSTVSHASRRHSTVITAIASITGNPQAGQVLTHGAITPSASTATYQWQSSASSGGTYTNISGATHPTYTVASGDVGKFIKVVATGSILSTGSATSAYIGIVGTPVTAISAITGSTSVGQTLTAGTLTPSGATVSYQWRRADTSGGSYSDISSATSSTYTLVSGDNGKYIKVVATGTGSYSSSVTSAATAVVTSGTPVTAIAAITGTTSVGQVLTHGALTPGGATVTYQWQSAATSGGSYTNISSATSPTYTLVSGDAGRYIKVIATGTGSYTGTVTSVATTVVTSSSSVDIAGSAFTASNGSEAWWGSDYIDDGDGCYWNWDTDTTFDLTPYSSGTISSASITWSGGSYGGSNGGVNKAIYRSDTWVPLDWWDTTSYITSSSAVAITTYAQVKKGTTMQVWFGSDYGSCDNDVWGVQMGMTSPVLHFTWAP